MKMTITLPRPNHHWLFKCYFFPMETVLKVRLLSYTFIFQSCEVQLKKAHMGVQSQTKDLHVRTVKSLLMSQTDFSLVSSGSRKLLDPPAKVIQHQRIHKQHYNFTWKQLFLQIHHNHSYCYSPFCKWWNKDSDKLSESANRSNKNKDRETLNIQLSLI